MSVAVERLPIPPRCHRAIALLARRREVQHEFCEARWLPGTRQSGKHNSVHFRWAADKQLRDAICDFAGDSRRANPWAADLYRRAITRGHDHPHAVRILARAWLFVIWHCWQNGTPYNPAQHRALQAPLRPAA